MASADLATDQSAFTLDDLYSLLNEFQASLFTRHAELDLKKTARPFFAEAIKFAKQESSLETIASLVPEARRVLELHLPRVPALGLQARPQPDDWLAILVNHGSGTLARLDAPPPAPGVPSEAAGSSQQSGPSPVLGVLEPSQELRVRGPLEERSGISDPIGQRPQIERSLFTPAHAVTVPPEEDRWLVDDLLARQGVAVIGGHPKLGKSWLAAELSVAVASGTPCLGEFTVRRSGPVLLCAAEGPPWMTTDRLLGICQHRGLALDSLPIHVMTDHLIRLDVADDQVVLRAEVQRYSPALLVIDPLVSFHQADENAAGALTPVLQYLDTLRKELGVTVLLAHHVSKKASGSGGRRLRGSGALHAWVDSGLYREEREGMTVLTLEQRTGPARAPMAVKLVGNDDDQHLEMEPIEATTGADPTLKAKIVEELARLQQRTSREALRKRLAVKNASLTAPLQELAAEGIIDRDPRGGICLTVPVPAPLVGNGNG